MTMQDKTTDAELKPCAVCGAKKGGCPFCGGRGYTNSVPSPRPIVRDDVSEAIARVTRECDEADRRTARTFGPCGPAILDLTVTIDRADARALLAMQAASRPVDGLGEQGEMIERVARAIVTARYGEGALEGASNYLTEDDLKQALAAIEAYRPVDSETRKPV